MPPLTEILPNTFAVEIPKGYKFSIADDGYLYHYKGSGIVTANRTSNLDFTDWQIMFQTKDAREEDWKGVIPREDGDRMWQPSYNDPDSGGLGYYYDDYKHGGMSDCFHTATESGLSLLTSKGLDTEKNYLIIKNK